MNTSVSVTGEAIAEEPKSSPSMTAERLTEIRENMGQSNTWGWTDITVFVEVAGIKASHIIHDCSYPKWEDFIADSNDDWDLLRHAIDDCIEDLKSRFFKVAMAIGAEFSGDFFCGLRAELLQAMRSTQPEVKKIVNGESLNWTVEWQSDWQPE